MAWQNYNLVFLLFFFNTWPMPSPAVSPSQADDINLFEVQNKK